MRMWMIDPTLLCDKHLLGEHREIHTFIGTILKGKSIKGYIEKGLVEPSFLYSRHEILVEEMCQGRLWTGHKTPISLYEKLQIDLQPLGWVCRARSLVELVARCPICRLKILNRFTHRPYVSL